MTYEPAPPTAPLVKKEMLKLPIKSCSDEPCSVLGKDNCTCFENT